MQVDLFFVLLTLQQLQAGAASCAHMADLVFCVPLGAAGGSVAPTWTQMNITGFCAGRFETIVKNSVTKTKILKYTYCFEL